MKEFKAMHEISIQEEQLFSSGKEVEEPEKPTSAEKFQVFNFLVWIGT